MPFTSSWITSSCAPATTDPPLFTTNVTVTTPTEEPIADDSLTPDPRPLDDIVSLPSPDTTTASIYVDDVVVPPYVNTLESYVIVITHAVSALPFVEAVTDTLKLSPAYTGC